MQLRRIGWVSAGALLSAVWGCDTLSSVKSGADSTTSNLQSGKSSVDQNKDQTKQEIDKAKGGAAGGAGGAAGGDSEGNTRLSAKEAKPNEIITDDVGLKKNNGNPADWRKFDLQGAAGLVKIKLRWDDPKADLNVDLLDAFGESVAASPGKQREPEKKIVARIQAGMYYVRVQPAPLPDPKATPVGSVYTMKVEWAGAPAAAAPAAAAGGQVPPPGSAPAAPGAPGAPGAPAPGAPAAPAKIVYPTAEDPAHPRCNVLQAYRDDDGKMILYLDRGSDAGAKVGMNGTLLTGKDGDAPMDGGGFKITKVIDKQKSVAKGEMATVGKNKRCRIDLVKWTAPPIQ